MSRTIDLLDQVRIASPCTAAWADMVGDDRVRFCKECKLNVYNFSEMSRVEAEQLIIEKQGKLCGRYYARADGTIITKDCPIGWQRLKQRFWWTISSAAAVFVAAVSFLFASTDNDRYWRFLRLQSLDPFKKAPKEVNSPFGDCQGLVSISGDPH